MAIARGAGTEIIRSASFEDVSNTEVVMIYGVQHHIYTVLSITCHPRSLNATGDYIQLKLLGYDSLGGTTAQNTHIFQQDMTLYTTFVWNDKFSFNGYEPVDFAGPMDDATKQDAIADQGSSVAQVLKVVAEHASDAFDCTITYIDQNNA